MLPPLWAAAFQPDDTGAALLMVGVVRAAAASVMQATNTALKRANCMDLAPSEQRLMRIMPFRQQGNLMSKAKGSLLL